MISENGLTRSLLLSSKYFPISNAFGVISHSLAYINRSLDLNESGGLLNLNLPTNVHPIFIATNGPRDRDRRVAGVFIGEAISKYDLFHPLNVNNLSI